MADEETPDETPEAEAETASPGCRARGEPSRGC